MSKTSIIHHINVGKVNTKVKPGTRNSYSKLTLDLNSIDRKTQNNNTGLHQDKNLYHPNSPVEKLGMMHQSQTKSPRSKNNSSGYPMDAFEVKDSFRYDTKIQPHTTKGAAPTSYVDIKFDKSKKGINSTEKLVPSKLKEYQMKNLFPGFQIPNKKPGQPSEPAHKVGLSINLKDSRSKIIMEEPPKKFSVPNAYIMPHSIVGSGSHRGPLVTSKGDLTDANGGPFTYMPFKRKGSQKLETEYEQHMHASITNKYGLGQGGNVSNVLNDLTSLPLELTKSNSKTTVNNTTNNIITNIMIGEKVPSPKGSNNFSSQYNDLLRLINEKDKEIQKLNSEKTDLKSTLNSLTNGVEDFRSMKYVLKEKERIITSLKNSLSVAIKESDVLRGEITAPEIQSGGHSYKHSNKNSSFDIEGIKSLMYEIKSLEQDDDNDTDHYETGNSQPDKVIKKTLSLKTKKSEPSQPGSAAGHYRFATNNSVIEDASAKDQHTKDLLGNSQESPLLKKSKDSSSPYYELIKGAKKDLKISLENKKEIKSSDKVGSGSDVQTTRVRTANTIVIKKRDPMGTPRKLQVNTDNVDAPAKTNYPNTTTGADVDMFKRKFSHDPRVITDGFREFGTKKNSVIDLGSPATHHSNSGKVTQEQGLDIGKALGELKNKIARLLDRHSNEHKNLRNIQDGYLKKLNELLDKQQ